MKLRRSYFLALAVSFVAMIVAGLVAYKILASIPTTAWAQQMRFIQINNGSPAVYPSEWFREHSAQVDQEDEMVTLAVMLVAGLAFGLMFARATFRETIGYAVGTAVVLSLLILGMDVYGTYLEQQAARSSGTIYGVIIDRRYFFDAVGSVILRTALYTAGAVCGCLIRRRFTRSGQALAPGAPKPKPAATAP